MSQDLEERATELSLRIAAMYPKPAAEIILIHLRRVYEAGRRAGLEEAAERCAAHAVWLGNRHPDGRDGELDCERFVRDLQEKPDADA